MGSKKPARDDILLPDELLEESWWDEERAVERHARRRDVEADEL